MYCSTEIDIEGADRATVCESDRDRQLVRARKVRVRARQRASERERAFVSFIQ